MSYKIKEIFLTQQGEGFNTGKEAIFCRFSGCNLWNGIDKYKSKSICTFCDTDFKGVNGENGGSYSLNQLINKIKSFEIKKTSKKFIVFTYQGSLKIIPFISFLYYLTRSVIRFSNPIIK